MSCRKNSYIFVYLFLNVFNSSCVDGGSLTFVIDDTRSMWDDIDQVNQAVGGIFDIVLKSNTNNINNFVLVTFNDPNVVLRTKTSSLSTLKYHLNRVIAHNNRNYDCEEMTLSGLETALLETEPHSHIFVFSDAAAKDYRKVKEIKRLCQRKQSRVVFIMTGDCGSPRAETFTVYYDIAAASSGQVFSVEKSSVNLVLEYVKALVKGSTTVVTTQVLKPLGYFKAVLFNIDEDAEYAIVSASGQNIELQVTTTSDRFGNKPQSKQVTWTRNAKVLNVFDLTPGTYYAWTKADSNMTLVVYARSDFTFEHGFSTLEPKSLDDSSKQPIAGQRQHLYINFTDPNHSVDVKSVRILDMLENIIKVMPLKKSNGDIYITDRFESPAYMFKIAVTGVIKKTGRAITRLSNTAIEPQLPAIEETMPVVTIKEGSRLNVTYGVEVSLTCKVSATPEPKIEWSTADGSLLPSKSFAGDLPSYVSYMKLKNAKSGTYICKGFNKHGSGSQRIEVIAQAFRTISKPKERTIANYNKEVKIRCDIRSSQPMGIKWFRSNSEVTSGGVFSLSPDGSELTIKNMDLALQGNYSCKAFLKNKSNEKQVYNTILEISDLAKPAIKTSKKSIIVLEKYQFELSCNITGGNPKPSVKWFKRHETAFKPFNNKEYLVIHYASLNDAGQYRCVAENIMGSVTEDFEVTVNKKPEKIYAEIARTVSYDSTEDFKCQFEAHPAPRIEWKDEYGTFIQNQIYQNGYRYTTQLKLKNLIKSTKYRCIASNAFGSVSEYVNITVLSPFNVQRHPAETIRIEYGKQNTIMCDITSSVPIIIKWYRQDNVSKIITEINESPKYYLSQDRTELNIKFMDVDLVGKYTCEAHVVKDANEKIFYNTDVQIVVPNVLENKEFNFTCTQNGNNSKPSIECNMGFGAVIFPPIVIYPPFFVFPPFVFPGGGGGGTENVPKKQYKCKTKNKNDSDEEDSEETEENKSPQMINTRTAKTVSYGSEEELTCDVLANPAPLIKWKDEKGAYLPSKMSKQGSKYSSQLRLKNIQKSAQYSCTASNKIGSASKDVKITVLSPFDVRSYPGEITELDYGKQKAIVCDIRSSFSFILKWYRQDGKSKQIKEINESIKYSISPDRTKLNIKSMDFDHVGKYTCKAYLVKDENEKISFSTDVQLMGVSAPEISDSTFNIKNKHLTVVCRIKGVPKPTISWQFKAKGSETFNTKPGSEEELHVPSVGLQHSGVYKCIAKNDLGEVDHDSNVVIEEAANISNEKNVFIGMKGDVVLKISCNVTGFPDPIVTWKENGKTIENKKYEIKKNVLFIKYPEEQDSTNFTCEAKNKLGTATRQFEAIIIGKTVNKAPEMLNVETARTVPHGSEAEFTCKVQAQPAPKIEWKNGKGTVLQTKMSQNASVYSALLKIKSMQKSAQYSCTASNKFGGVTKVLNITVLAPFDVLIYPAETTRIDYGKQKTIICDIRSSFPILIKWYRRDNKSKIMMEITESPEYSISPNRTELNIKFMDSDLVGKYTCEAYLVNDEKEKVTYNTDVHIVGVGKTVNKAPEILNVEAARMVPYGSDVEFTCEVLAHPAPIIEWKNDKGIVVQTNMSQNEFVYRALLKIKSMQKSAQYSCTASNKFGGVTKVLNITVLAPFDILIYPAETTRIDYGKQKTIICDIRSSFPILIKWYRQDNKSKKMMEINESLQYSISTNRTELNIKFMDSDLVGKYTCEAYLVNDETKKVTYNTDVLMSVVE